MEQILGDLRQGKTFPCHMEKKRRGQPRRICAGSLGWQRKNGCVPDAVQIVERLLAYREGRRPRW